MTKGKGKSNKPFIPNGCGAGWTGAVVPDEFGKVRFKDCCDLHDLGYHIGGSLWKKLTHDAGLAACMGDRWFLSIKEDVPWWRKAGRTVGWVIVPTLYFSAVTLLGWTPLTWRYKPRRLDPKDFNKLAELGPDGLARLKRM